MPAMRLRQPPSLLVAAQAELDQVEVPAEPRRQNWDAGGAWPRRKTTTASGETLSNAKGNGPHTEA